MDLELEDGEVVEGQTKGRTWSPHEDAALGLAFLEVNGESGPTGNNYRTEQVVLRYCDQLDVVGEGWGQHVPPWSDIPAGRGATGDLTMAWSKANRVIYKVAAKGKKDKLMQRFDKLKAAGMKFTAYYKQYVTRANVCAPPHLFHCVF